jgi:acyl carrier protein
MSEFEPFQSTQRYGNAALHWLDVATMMFDRDKALDELVRFVQSRGQDHAHVTPQTDLLETGLLDSLMLVDLIFHLEELYGIRFESDHIDPVNFHNIAVIVDLVDNRLSAPVSRLG